MKKILSVAALVFYFIFTPIVAPILVYGQDRTGTGNQVTNPAGNQVTNPGGNQVTNPGGNQQTADTKGTVVLPIKIINPLGVNTIQEAIKKIMDIILTILMPVIVIFFIYAGFLFVTARGNKEQLKKAKNMFWYTLIGTLLIVGAWTIATAIVNTVNEITGP